MPEHMDSRSRKLNGGGDGEMGEGGERTPTSR